MSVINKMLKDLDERNVDQGHGEANGQHNQFIPSPKKPINWLLLVMILILVVLAFIGWQLSQNEHTPSNSRANVSAANAEPSVPNSTISTPTHSTVGASSVLQNAENVEPANSVNRAQMAQQDADLKTALNETKTELAGQEPVPDDALQQVHQTKSEPTAANFNASNLASTNTTVKSKPSVVTGGVNGGGPALQADDNAAGQPQSKPAEDSGQFVIERSNAKLSPQQQVEKLLSKAKSSFDKGYITEGISQLEQVLSLSDSHVEARNLLAGAWYGRGESNRAISILNNGLQRYPNIESWRLTAAKIFFKENNLAGALSYLDTEMADVSKEFLTMKGSLGRQLQQFDKSEQAYQRLAELEPTVGNWWLGLAIAQDSQGKAEQALIGYQKLVKLGGVSQDSLAFAKKRITELQG